MGTSEVGAELPRYRCHKEVHALKIAAIETRSDKSAVIAPADPGYAPFEVAAPWAERFKGSEQDLGYYVVYEDGYASWSPTKAFEEGYAPIQGNAPDAVAAERERCVKILEDAEGECWDPHSCCDLTKLADKIRSGK